MATPSSRIVRLPQPAGEPLRANHQKLIEDSRISPEVAAARGYRSVVDPAELLALEVEVPTREGRPEIARFLPNQARTPALLNPVRDITGKVRSYYLRPDHPRPDARRKDKFRKYETPTGSKHILDIPVGLVEQLADPTIPLWITEGSRKVDALVSQGATAIGVMGVWSFNPHERADSQISWDGIELHGRLVYVVYDSDIMTKDPVRKSLEAISQKLRSKGARIQIVQLPHLPDGGKCGIDDYFGLGHTVEEAEKLARSTAATNRVSAITTRLDPVEVRELLDGRLKRSERISLAERIVRDLELRGTLYREASEEKTFYFQDGETHRLHAFDWAIGSSSFRGSTFAARLFKWYEVNANDYDLLIDVQSVYTNRSRATSPLRDFYCTDDTLYVQASDTQLYRVARNGIELVPNGTDDMLFREGVEEPLVVSDQLLYNQPQSRSWRAMVDQLSLDRPVVLTDQQIRTFLEVYLHLAPWGWNWQGLELPMLSCVGEHGSGKSHFWYVVQGVHYGLEGGISSVHTPPRDLQELRAYLMNTVGFCIFDNFRRGSVKTWWDEFETTLSLAVTHKHISYRPLHTDDKVKIPTRIIPIITSTQMPAVGSDLVERTIRINFKRLDFQGTAEGQAETGTQQLWTSHVLNVAPGRERLLADLLKAWTKFLELAETRGSEYTRQKGRLAGFDRALMLMAEAIGGNQLRSEMAEIVQKLPRVISQTQVNADDALAMLRRFAIDFQRSLLKEPGKKNEFRLKEIVAYVETLSFLHEGKKAYPFQSPQELARYFDGRESLVREQTGIYKGRSNAMTSYFTIDLEQLQAVVTQIGGEEAREP